MNDSGYSKNVAFDRQLSTSSIPMNGTIRRLLKNKVAVFCFIIFLLICLSCLMAPFLTRWDYHTVNAYNRMAPPSSTHIFGTDGLGRDMFSRFLYGGRITLGIAFLSSIAAMIIGGLVGLIAGFFHDRIDFIITSVLDIIASIPVIMLAIVVEAVFGFGRGYFVYAMIIASIPGFARLVRASVMTIMGRTYIEAARALGVSRLSLVFRHILHNIASPLIVGYMSGLAEALLTCTIMGYLNIGIRPPIPEWGAIASLAKASMRVSPYLFIISCSVITACIVSLSLFCDALRDAFDPRDKTNSP